MIEAVIIALIIAKIKGYSLKPFFKSWTIYLSRNFFKSYCNGC